MRKWWGEPAVRKCHSPTSAPSVPPCENFRWSGAKPKRVGKAKRPLDATFCPVQIDADRAWAADLKFFSDPGIQRAGISQTAGDPARPED